MRKYLNKLANLKSDDDGAALIEYTVLIGVMLVAVIAIIVGVGSWISSHWASLSNSLL